MKKPATAILHYSAPPVVGGVEAVIEAHVRAFLESGYPVTVVAGVGEAKALTDGANFIHIPELDTQHTVVKRMSESLEAGQVPDDFEAMAGSLTVSMGNVLGSFDHLIAHNVFTKHFNLALTAALFRLLDAGQIKRCIAWCHDMTWTSPHSRSKVFPRYPWDLLRMHRKEVTYVAVSKSRQRALAELFDCPLEEIQVIYNSVDPQTLLGLSPDGYRLVSCLGLFESELVLLMPVRVTQAKNIELALRVVAELKDQGCQPKLILTGPPDPHDPGSMEYYRSLKTLRRQLGIEQEMRFVFESGPDPEEPYFIDAGVVGDLYRASDILFLPSHREGFGIPVLEAGLSGLPVFCTQVPAAVELAGTEVVPISADEPPHSIAGKLLDWAESSPVHRLRRKVRRNYTWQAIFREQIEPLISRQGTQVHR